jgi:hypothetical protein
MFRVLVFLPLRSFSVDASCDKTGFQRVNEYWWDDRDNWQNHYQSFVAWDGFPYTHYLGIKGSYVAHEEGSHSFRVYREYWSGSIGLPECDYESDFVSKRLTDGDDIYWVDGPHTFHPYFRYRIFCRYREGSGKANSQLDLQISTPSANAFATMTDQTGGRACDQSGCDDMSLKRDSWSCRPHPPSPTRTVSQSPIATPSIAFVHSAVLRPTPLAHNSAPLVNSELYASIVHEQTASLSESSLPTDSLEFNHSQQFPNSFGVDLSVVFDSTDELNESGAPAGSELGTPSDFLTGSVRWPKSSRFDATANLDKSNDVGASGSFADSDTVQGPSLKRSSPSFAVAGSVIAVFVAIGLIVALTVFVWRGKTRTSTGSEVEMGVDSTTGQPEFMSTLSDTAMGVATQYQTAVDGDPGLQFAGGDTFQESIFAF